MIRDHIGDCLVKHFKTNFDLLLLAIDGRVPTTHPIYITLKVPNIQVTCVSSPSEIYNDQNYESKILVHKDRRYSTFLPSSL
jgi:hypothetical protein